MAVRRQAKKTIAQSYRDLLEITRLITGSLDYGVVLSTVAKEAARLLGGEAAAILLLDAAGKLRVAASHNIPARCVTDVQIPLGPSVMPSLRGFCADIALAGFIGVPLVLRGQTIGVLAVYCRTWRKPRAVDEELLSALADQAAIAIDNARLYKAEQAARSAAEMAQDRTAEILEGITDAFFAVDRYWCFVYINKEAERRLGRRREDLIGKSLWNEFPEIAGSALFEEMHRAVLQQTELALEAKWPVDGKRIEAHIYPSERGLSVYLHDVTEHRSA